MYFSTSASVYQYLVNEGKIKNCAVDFLGPGKWPFKNYSTWNDPDNSFYDLKTRTSYITDHMFLRTKSPEKIQAQTSAFEVMKLKTACKPTGGEEKVKTNYQLAKECPSYTDTLKELNLTQCDSNMPTEKSLFAMHLKMAQRRSRANCDPENRISLSDHEAVTATIRIRKLGINANKSETIKKFI